MCVVVWCMPAQMWIFMLSLLLQKKYYNYMHWTVLCRANLMPVNGKIKVCVFYIKFTTTFEHADSVELLLKCCHNFTKLGKLLKKSFKSIKLFVQF